MSPPKRQGTASAARRERTQLTPGSSIWNQVQDDDILLVISLQGIQIVQNSKRDKILLHVDFSDLLYVMGKGHRLKLGFVMQHSNVLNATQLVDCRTEFSTARIAGHKARSIAEDILAYAQLRLLEMTKNDSAEFLHRNYAAVFLDRIEGEHKPAQESSSLLTDDPLDDGGADDTLRSQPAPNQNPVEAASTSFKGL